MAKDEGKELRTRMHEGKLPADRKTPELPATREPRDPSQAAKADRDVTPRGKTPEEVLGEREEKSAKPVKAVEEPTPPAKKWKIRDEELTLDQIAERGLMDALVTTHEQHKYLQEKYEKTLEKIADGSIETKKVPAVTEPPPVVRPTPQQILSHFTPRMLKAAEEGYIEAELPEAYPHLMSNLMYFADIIETHAAELYNMKEWIRAEITIRNARNATQMLNDAVDQVAGMKGKIYEMLRDPGHKKKFIDWLYKEVDPQLRELTAEKLQTYYLAFNSEALMELAQRGGEKETPAPKPRIRSEGSGASIEIPEPAPAPKSLLKRMTESRLGPREE